MAFSIYIVEDDETIGHLVAGHLARYGYVVTLTKDFREVEREFESLQPNLVVMDVNLPYQDGFHLCRAIRRKSKVPLLFLTARSGEMEQVLGIESGGDDYLVKPFHLEVLLAKVKAILRRTYGEYAGAGAQAGTTMMRLGGLELNLSRGELGFRGKTERLTHNELMLIRILMEKVGELASREECLEALWDDVSFVDDNTLTVNVTRLRAKLESLGLKDAIETRRGMGYRLAVERLEACAG